MSPTSATPEDAGDAHASPPHAHDEGGADGAAYARNGSLAAKLFAKNRSQVAVGEDSGQDDNYEQEDDEDDVDSDGDVEEDEEDDEYVPGASDEEDAGESDDDGGDDDLDDEETSMRSLLLPMATYAKQLLFLSEEDDDGEFDAQDAELWESPQEKREWIARYEAQNRAYIDQYGCRIDAPAIPDLKKRLRRERDREAKYSLVLLALALAYLVRLLVGPTTTPSIDLGATVAAPDAQSQVIESTVNTPSPQVTTEWDSSSSPWWTAWTEELVVRAIAWPQSMLSSFQSAILASSSRNSRGDSLPSDNAPRNEQVASVEPSTAPPSPAAADNHDDTPPTRSPPTESEEDMIGASTTSTSDELTVEREVTTVEVSIDPSGDSSARLAADGGPDHTDTQEQQAVSATNEDVSRDEKLIKSDSGDARTTADTEKLIKSDSGDARTTADTDRAIAKVDIDVESVSETPESAKEGGSSTGPVEEAHKEDSTRDMVINEQEMKPDESLKRCTDMFYMLLKMKNDASAKAAAISECDRAVDAAQQLSGIYLIQARLLRGDMNSILQQFDEANQDYEAALNTETEESTMLRSDIEIKIASNRWIEYYHRKMFKELRSDCLRVRDASPTTSAPGSPDRVRELAVEWLRLFRKEVKPLEVLTKTRAWTLHRPATP